MTTITITVVLSDLEPDDLEPVMLDVLPAIQAQVEDYDHEVTWVLT
jgi:hypothetical protein